MSVPFSGARFPSRGPMGLIIKELQRFTLAPVKRVTVQFNPFHEKAHEVRNFVHQISARKYTRTNPDCVIQTKVVCDNSEPTVTFNLSAGNQMVMKTANLKTSDILRLYNDNVEPLLRQEGIEVAKKQKVKHLRGQTWFKPGSKHRGIIF